MAYGRKSEPFGLGVRGAWVSLHDYGLLGVPRDGMGKDMVLRAASKLDSVVVMIPRDGAVS